ncbi:MAG: hypothetical protein LRY53_08100 [Burkholderiaceae bacterium]|nr:hypothetical protein [Burkholderiaceae bacterium]MCD8517632.1 hypothetical protein [Burkholderiaceae bacterium]MCD8537425.1 hypothetical protein [Burkholderiaceae bacterium]MCD8565584.1 hypothetical protein [Burkholderiaceae bacterium]
MKPTTFTIKFYGHGIQAGIGKVTKKTHDFWKDSDHILEATDPNEAFDYATVGVSTANLKLKPFWEYDDIVRFDGLLLDSFRIEVVGEDTQLVTAADSDQIQGNDAIDGEDFVEEIDEFYRDSDLGQGFYLAWTREGDQLWFTGEIAIDRVGFDLQQLRLKTVDYEGDAYVVQVFYGDAQLVNTESGIRWSKPEIEFIAVKQSTRSVSGWKHELY